MAVLAIAAQKVWTPLEEIADGLVLVEDGFLRAVGRREEIAVPSGSRRVDLGERIVAPGFVDIHIHGAAGHDVMEATPEALGAVARLLARHGTTSFLPTTLTAPLPALLRSLRGLGAILPNWKSEGGKSAEPLAEPLGIHLEGPFLSLRCRGAHPSEHLQQPSRELFQQFCEAASGGIRTLTLAPELEGASEVVVEAVRRGIRVGIGHSHATYDEARRAIQTGASHAVHVFNAMRPFAHRDPGILGAVLTEDSFPAEVIADGVHVSAPALRLLIRAKGIAQVMLVTDAVSATGIGPGVYRLGEMQIVVAEEIATGSLVCRTREGTLAGSVLTQDRAIRHMAGAAQVSLREAVQMATWNPARLLGLENRKGFLRTGADADLVVLNPDGTVVGVMAAGRADFA